MNGDATKKSANDGVNVKLAKAMGSKSGETDPIPPRQYEAFREDVNESPRLRIWSAILSRTIHRGHDLDRSAFAREPETGDVTKAKHLVVALDLKKSEVSEQLHGLQKEGRIDMRDGRIYLCAEVPKPAKERLKEKGEEEAKVTCTVNLNYLEANFLSNLEAVDPERFQAAAVAVVVSEEWGMKVKAEAIAWARDRASDARQQVFTEIGYTNSEKRGAEKRRERTATEELKPTQSFTQFTIQRTVEIEKAGTRFTVQGQSLTVYVETKESRTNEHPYAAEFESSESQLASNESANAARATSQAEIKRAQRIAEAKIEVNALIQDKRLKIGMGAAALTAGTVTVIATYLAQLPTAGAVLEVIDTLAKRITEYQTGNPREVEKIGAYLVGIAQKEVEERLTINVKAGAEKMSMPGKAKAQKAGGR